MIVILSFIIKREKNTRLSAPVPNSDHTFVSTFFLPEKIGFPTLALLSIGLLLVQALNSHAASLNKANNLAIGVDLLHLLAASFWVGGLAGMAISLFSLFRTDRASFSMLVRSTWGQFSRVAAISVALVASTGIFSLGQQVASIDALITTTYGHGLLIKIVLFLACGGFGLLNSVLLHPQLASPIAHLFHRPSGWTPISFKRRPFLVITELSLGVLLIGMAAVVTNSTPAHGQQYIPAGDIPSSVTSIANDLWITFSAKPNQPGQNVLSIEVDNSLRPAPAPVQQVLVAFNITGQKRSQDPILARQIDTNLYQLTGNYFDQMGDWQVEVMVRRQGFPDAVTLLAWTVAPPGGPRPIIISDQPLDAILTPLSGIMLVSLIIILIVTWPKKSRGSVPVLDNFVEADTPQKIEPARTRRHKATRS
jgi:copper transport protein